MIEIDRKPTDTRIMNVFHDAAQIMSERGWSKNEEELLAVVGNTPKPGRPVCLLIATAEAAAESGDHEAYEWGRDYFLRNVGIGYVRSNNLLANGSEAIQLLNDMGDEYAIYLS